MLELVVALTSFSRPIKEPIVMWMDAVEVTGSRIEVARKGTYHVWAWAKTGDAHTEITSASTTPQRLKITADRISP